MPNDFVQVQPDSTGKKVDCEPVVQDDGTIVERQRVARVDDLFVQARRQAEAQQLAPLVDVELATRRHAERSSNLTDRRGRTGRGVR